MKTGDLNDKPKGVLTLGPLPVGPPQSIVKLVVPGVLLVLVCLLPYLNKAYTNDDPCFLLSARQILKTPLQPMSYSLCWLLAKGEECVKSAASVGPGAAQALMGYLLVPAILAGGSERVAHLLQILLLCVAVVEMVRLALRLGFDRVQATAAGLMLVAIPPLLWMASTVMPDIAALTFGLTGMERLLAWKDDRRWHQAAAAALALGLAPYGRPHLVLLVPLGALWLFNEFRIGKALQQFRREAYLWAPLLIAVCILVTVLLVTRDHGPKVESTNRFAGFQNASRNLSAYLMYLAYPIPFAAVWLAAFWRRSPLVFVLPALAVLAFHFLRHPGMSLAEEWAKTAVLYGLTALVYMIYQYVRTSDRLGILLSLWVLIPVPVVLYVQLPIKYMVGVMPAIVLIIMRVLSTLPRPRELSAYGAVVLVCGAFSCLLVKADADFTECGRRAVAELIAPRVAAGERVWYGGILGFYWYAQEAGATVSKPGEPGPLPGELLVVGLSEFGAMTRDRFPHRELIESRQYELPHGRTMGGGGALYTNNFGRALWVWNPEVTNDYEVWRIH